MFSRFFIDRPVFAAVLSIIIVMVGLVTLRSLPVAQYPEIAPPTIMVNASYPGAGARVMANTVAQPIEEQVNGVEGMLYMSSYSTNNGEYALTVTFEVGTDLDMAQVLVQNRVSQAESLLPEAVQRMGLTVEKQSNNILLLISLTSPEKKFDGLYLSNFAGLELRDELARLDGVGSVKVFGATDYSMRIWLDPDRLKARSLTTSDVISAVREQNVQVAAGQLGQPPGKSSQPFQYALNVQGRLKDISQFEDIILKGSPGKGMVRLKDVARIELGAKSYNMSCTSMGDESAVIGIFLQPGANALEVGNRVKSRMVELSGGFPDGIVYNIGFDTTDYVEESINEVVETL
ncbi:MAG: efflux RND transporter permease subunit, partial [Desulfobacterales bacterium]|nr:efflux RND transporter permease subunit [Desulfobacterales bacterium]